MKNTRSVTRRKAFPPLSMTLFVHTRAGTTQRRARATKITTQVYCYVTPVHAETSWTQAGWSAPRKHATLTLPATSPNHLLPPGGKAGAEVSLGPGGEGDDVGVADGEVSEGEGQRGGTADDLALVVVLGAVARALELVLSLVPGDNAAKVGAHSVEAEIGNGAVGLDDDVSGVTLLIEREERDDARCVNDVASASRVSRRASTASPDQTRGYFKDRSDHWQCAVGFPIRSFARFFAPHTRALSTAIAQPKRRRTPPINARDSTHLPPDQRRFARSTAADVPPRLPMERPLPLAW